MSDSPLNFLQASVRANELVANNRLGIGTHTQTAPLHVKAAAAEIRLEDGENNGQVTETALKISTDGGVTSFQSGTSFTDGTTGEFKFQNMGATNTYMTVNTDEVAIKGGSLELTQVSNVAQIKSSSNVVTEFNRSKKLIKYPRVAMTAATTAGYTASASTNITNWEPWKAFNHLTGGESEQGWHSAASTYNTSGVYTSDKYIDDVQGTRYKGEWIKLKLEEKIKLKSVRLTNRTNLAVRNPQDATVLGSNDDSNWYVVGSWFDSYWREYVNQEFEMDSDTYYQYYAIVVQKCRVGTNVDSVQIAEIEFEGVPEYDAEAHGTDVVTRFVPNAASDDHLLLYYDAKDYTSNPANATANTILDLSGNGRHASSNNVTIDTTYGAFVIPSNGGILQDGLALGFSGDQSHTIAVWFKLVRDYTNNPNPMMFDYRSAYGNTTTAGATGLFVFSSFAKVAFYHHSADINAYAKIESDTWYHLVGTYKEGGVYPTYSSVYLNGEPLGAWSAATAESLSVPSSGLLRLGNFAEDADYNFVGSIGNARVFGRSLKEQEVWQLYASERARFGYGDRDVVSLKNGCMGIGTLDPRAVLDVRGTIMGKNPAFFCASVNSGHVVGPADPIIYNTIGDDGWITGVNTNKHYGYDTSTGFFTAPVAGHYYFSCYGMNLNYLYICQMSFYLNNSIVEGTTHYQARPYGDGSGTYAHQTGGMTTIQYMRKGDRMRVKLEGGTLYGAGYGFNGFMGFYLSS